MANNYTENNTAFIGEHQDRKHVFSIYRKIVTPFKRIPQMLEANKNRWPLWRTLALALFIAAVLAAYLLYRNTNKLLAKALENSFNATMLADVYELTFDDLWVDVTQGSIRVKNVVFRRREKPFADYPYINSSILLKTDRLILEKVDIKTLLAENRLLLEKIRIDKPMVELTLNGERHILVPFKDSMEVANTEKKAKKPIGAFSLKVFELIDARFHVTNNFNEREFEIENFGVSLHDLFVNQEPNQYSTTFSQVDLSIGKFVGDMRKESIKTVLFNDFGIRIDSLDVKFSLDTVLYKFHDLHTEMHNLEIVTADSLFNMSMKSFDLSYLKKSIELKHVSFNPNVGHAELQKMHKHQHTEFSGSVGSININGITFDSIIYHNKIIIETITMDSVQAYIYKDNTKSIDTQKKPVYLGQTIAKIPIPLTVGKVTITNAALENTERKPDGNLAKATIGRARVDVSNITNMDATNGLNIAASGFVLDKIKFEATMLFNYKKPLFHFGGKLGTFDLKDLNPLIEAYTPTKIEQGVADEVVFRGTATHTTSTGTLKFLYHDLKIIVALKDQADWKNSALALTANSVLNNHNPESPNHPPREVKFEVQRDMNKGFVNIIIKSILQGFKETMVMSKENRKDYKKAKKEKAKAEKPANQTN
jgi:hypothetical protein